MKYIVQPVVPAHAAMPQYATDRRYTLVAAHSGLVAGVRDGDILLEQQNWQEDERQQWRIERIPDGIEADLLAIGTDGQLYRRIGWYGAWEVVPGGPAMRSLVVTREGRLLGVGADYQLYRRESLADPWELIPNSGLTVDVTILPNGHIVGVSPDGQMLMRPSLEQPWTTRSSNVRFVAVTALPTGAILAVLDDGRIMQRKTDEWEIVPNSGSMINITTMVDSGWLGVGADNRLYSRAIESEPWAPVPGRGGFIAVAAHARYYRIVNVASGKVMDVKEWSLDDRAPIHEWPWHGDFNQQWAVQHIGGGRFKITARVSGKSLDVAGEETAPGTPLIQYRWHGGRNQQWRLSEVKDGEQRPYARQATIYEHADYKGRSQQLGIGSFDMARLTIGNDTLSSIRVPEGIRVTLYEESNFRGAHHRFEQDTPWVGDDVNDKTSAVAVEQVATIFDQPNFQGQQQKIGVGGYNVADLALGDNAVRSLRVPDGLMVTLYENADYTGRPRVYTGDAPALDDLIDAATSSILVKAMGFAIPAGALRFGQTIALAAEALMLAKADGELTSGEPADVSETHLSFTRASDSKFTTYASYGDKVALTTYDGRSVRLLPGGRLRADAHSASDATPLTIVRAGDTSHNSFVAPGDLIALQTADGHYLTMTGAGISAASDELHPTRGRWRVTRPPGIKEGPPTTCAAEACATDVCSTDFCGTDACYADACGAAICSADAAIVSACGAAATIIGFCGADAAGAAVCGAALAGVGVAAITVCGADVCGAAACGAEACGGAACGVAACGAAACGLDAEGLDFCSIEAGLAEACAIEAGGVEICATEAGGIEACAMEACAAEACAVEVCVAEACAAEATLIEVCPADACGANVCAINACPADACAADACAIDVIPIIPGI